MVGRNAAALKAAVADVAQETGVSTREGSIGLEDVFIQFMGQSQGNMG